MATLKGLLPLLAIIAGILVISTKNAIISVFNLIVLYILVAFYLIYIGVTYLGISYIIIYIGAIAILFLFIIMMIDIEVVEKRSNNYLPLLFLLLSGFFFTIKKILYNIGLIKMKSLTYKEELILVDHRYGKLFNINNSKYNHGNDKKSVKFNSEIKDNPLSLDDDLHYKNNLLLMNMNEKYQNEEGNFDKFKFDSFFKDTKIEGYYNLYLNYLRDHNIEELISIKKDIVNYEQSLQGKNNKIFFQNIIDYSSKHFDDYLHWQVEQNVSKYYEDLSSKIPSDKRRIRRTRRSNKDEEINDNNVFIENECNKLVNNNDFIKKKIFFFNNSSESSNYLRELKTNYLLITPNWNSAASRITQITAIGDILYTVYHSYIYILSIILLLGMVGAIILTADNYQEIRVINISKNKKSSIFSLYSIINIWKSYLLYYNKIKNKFNFIKSYKISNIMLFVINNSSSLNKKEIRNMYKFTYIHFKDLRNSISFNWKCKKSIAIPSFFHTFDSDYLHSEDILGNLNYFIIANVIIALLLLSINSYFSLSVKYLEKGGGFECGFTSFVQTRERFNVIFYRVSLLFLVFDLEIILAFPYTAIYQKNQNISKNNVLAFLYILIIGFIYELKEGALNIMKKAHSTEININNNS